MFVGGNFPWWLDRQSVAGGGWITRLDAIAGADTAVPNRPTISYVGTNGFPVDGLVFQSSTFTDPRASTPSARCNGASPRFCPPTKW
jgi:hypothetical protein